MGPEEQEKEEDVLASLDAADAGPRGTCERAGVWSSTAELPGGLLHL